jgi:hypothetical protein
MICLKIMPKKVQNEENLRMAPHVLVPMLRRVTHIQMNIMKLDRR